MLQRFAQQATPSDYSFAMPNRRYLHLGFYLPSLHAPALADAVFVRDSSGSVTAETQAQFNAEILSTFYSLQPARLIVMDCDTRVTQVQIFERGDSPEIKPVRGGGGTAFVAPFERVLTDGINPAFLVYLTDMDGVIVRGTTLIPGAAEFLQRLRTQGIPFLILTNNSQYPLNGTQVVAVLPSGMEFDGDLDTRTTLQGRRNVVITAGRLVPGEKRTLQFQARIAETQSVGASLSVAATVRSSTAQPVAITPASTRIVAFP